MREEVTLVVDSAIVGLFWRRDESAIIETEKKYGKYLLKIALNILTDLEDGKESVNDTYLKAWNSMPPEKPGILSTYLGRITRQNSIDIYRKRMAGKRRGSEYTLSLSELDECVPYGKTPERELDTKTLAEAINAYVRKLQPEARSLFICRYYFLDSLKDSAAYCGMSLAKAKSMLFRARAGLKEHLEKEGFTI